MSSFVIPTTTKNLIVGFMGEHHGLYLKLWVPSGFIYNVYSDARAISWVPAWTDDIKDATDFGGQVEDVISWIHVFTSSTVNRVVKTVEVDNWAWEPMTYDELMGKSVAELKTIAKARNIRGRSQLNKSDLAKRLSR